jgi:hypothetical protein
MPQGYANARSQEADLSYQILSQRKCAVNALTMPS